MYTKMAENIYSIYVDMPYSPLKNLNAYLIKGEDRNLLIDTGDGRKECRDSLLRGLEELEVDLYKTDVFMTHLHTDHTGQLSTVYRPGMKVFMGRKDVELRYFNALYYNENYAANMRRRLGFPENEIRYGINGDVKQVRMDLFDKYICVDEGKVFSYGGYNFIAIDTPGHTVGQMCLYEPEHKMMFTGDHVLFNITPNISYWTEGENPLGDYINSLLKVRGLEVELPMPAHRSVTCTLAERVDQIIEHHGERVRETEEQLALHPGASSYELAGHVHWDIRYDGNWDHFPKTQKFYAASEVRAHLEYLVTRGRARSEERDGAVYYYPA